MWLSPEEFDKLVENTMAELPAAFLQLLENIVIVVVEEEPLPEERAVLGQKLNQELLGLYQGTPLPQRGIYYANTLPDRVVLFRGPLLRRCNTLEKLRDEVRATVIHELGHYFGLAEHQLL